jgi:hypothetical protein
MPPTRGAQRLGARGRGPPPAPLRLPLLLLLLPPPRRAAAPRANFTRPQQRRASCAVPLLYLSQPSRAIPGALAPPKQQDYAAPAAAAAALLLLLLLLLPRLLQRLLLLLPTCQA